jgi:hypothetical protein
MPDWDSLESLILVAGHAVPYRMDQLHEDSGWFLKHFQSGDGPLYRDHVKRAVQEAAADPTSLLVFAGGQTDERAGPRSEAQGYWLIADHHHWYGTPEVAARATTEEFSLDSFHNLLYGLCRFRECTGRYPQRVTAIGWGFKQERFRLHAEALRFPTVRFHYVGVNEPAGLDEARHFEALRTADFRNDPYGASAELAAKRAGRNPFRRQHGYQGSCPELASLLQHTGPKLYPGPLPWSD